MTWRGWLSAAGPSRGIGPRLEALEDRLAPAVSLVLNTNDSGPGSLRQAILDADAASGGEIHFAIPPGDPGYVPAADAFPIQPATPLPALTAAIALDGYTQPGASPNTLA